MVCLVIGVLSSIAVSSVRKARQGAQRARTAVEINTLRTEVEQYDLSKGCLPATLDDLGRADLVDAWGNPYVYTVAGPGTGHELGTDGMPVPPHARLGFCATIVSSVVGPGGQRAVASICSTGQESLEHGDATGMIHGE